MRTNALAALLTMLWCCIPDAVAWSAPPTELLTVRGFGGVSLYAPDTSPSQVVLFLSGDGGWNRGVIPMAEALRDQGALVVGIDTRAFMRTLEASDTCAYPAGSLEELSRAIQLHQKLPEYKAPILVGYSSGATLVYTAIAAAPRDTFAGAISLGFCPELEITRPPCQQRGLSVTRRSKGVGFDLAPNHQMQTPWMVLQGNVDRVCAPGTTSAFVAAIHAARLFSLPNVGHGFAVTRNWEPALLQAYAAIVRTPPRTIPAASAPEVRDLPVTETPVRSSEPTDVMAVILTGDGGWADLDRSIAAELSNRGVPSVGWNSLRYYWTPRTPDGAAADLARIIRHYTSAWGATRVVLIGYSFGADVLPFLVNRLSPDVSARVRQVALLGLSPAAQFEFRFSSWFGGGGPSAYPTAPEVARLDVPVLCVQGADEADSACRTLRAPDLTSIEIGRGHHFSGDYTRLVEVILARSEHRMMAAMSMWHLVKDHPRGDTSR